MPRDSVPPVLPLARHRDWLVAILPAAIVPLILYLLTMPPTITWWFGGSDSGDLVSAADVLGIPHPTGYPLFVLLGHLATRVPAGEMAARVNAMNALIAALGASSIALAVRSLATDTDGTAVRVTAAAVAALAIATGGLYWSQAIIGEVYALHAALTGLVLWLWARTSTHSALRGAAHGLALTNHLTSIILLAAAVAAYAHPFHPRRPDRRALWFVAGLLVPLCLYLVLPLRALQHPAANWGDPSTPGRFLAHVTGRQYRALVDWRDIGGTLRDLPALVRLLAGDLPLWTLPAAAIGFAALWRTRRTYAAFTGLTAGGALVFTAMYRVPDRAPYLLPTYVVVGIWCGAGLLAAAGATRHWAEGDPRRRAAVCTGSAAGALLLVLWAGRTGVRVNLRGDDSAVTFARATLEALPPGATYYTARDDVTFALWYTQRSLGVRRDVRVVDLRNPGLTSGR